MKVLKRKASTGREAAASSFRRRSIGPLQAQIFEKRRIAAHFRERRNGLDEDEKDALVLERDWRGANEEAQLTLAGNDNGLSLGRRGSQLHQHDGRSRSRHRRQCVHDNA
jgi:hypothetical protein